MRLSRRFVTAFTVAGVLAAAAVHRTAGAQPRPASGGPRIEIAFSTDARAEPVTGMVYVAISRDNQRTPIEQASRRASPLFSRFVEGSRPGRAAAITARRSRPSGREPARHARRRVLGAAVRQRLHAVPARRRPDRLAAHGSVGRAELEALARQSLRRSGEGDVRSDVGDADPPGRRQGDSADRSRRPTPRMVKRIKIQSDDPDQVVGPADLSRRDGAAAEGLRQASRRALSRSTTSRGTSRSARRAASAAAATSTGSGWPTTRRGSSTSRCSIRRRTTTTRTA